jgi:hypothetical protein
MAVRLSALRASRPLPPGRFLLLISVSYRVDPKAIGWLEGLQMKNPITSTGIKPMTFLLVTSCLNQLSYHVPHKNGSAQGKAFHTLSAAQIQPGPPRVDRLGVHLIKLLSNVSNYSV